VTKEPPQGVAFLPWVGLSAPLTIGRLRLLPYERGKAPGDVAHCTQESLDRVMSAYAGHQDRGIEDATLIEVGDWYTGMDADGKINEFFRLRDFIGMAALAKRRFFTHFQYCNFDTYHLVVQRFTKTSAGKQAVMSRRRDGSTMAYWAAKDFAFHRPMHVDGRASVDLEEALLKALLDLPAGSDHVLEAIREFAHANTDSPDVMPHVELIMMKSAFEWLLDSGPDIHPFRKALAAAFAGIKRIEDQEIKGPRKGAWQKAWPKADNLLDAWAREFHALRGSSAHGVQRNAPKFVWPLHTHLLFTATLFPLLLKMWCERKGLYKLDLRDREKLRRIEQYIAEDPLDPKYGEDNDEEIENPWKALEDECSLILLAQRMYGKTEPQASSKA